MKFWGRVWPHQCSMVFGMTELSQQNYENTLKYYYEFFMGTAPPDIWEQVDGKLLMKQKMFRNVNMYRMATMYVMKKKNPDMLKPKPKPIPPEEAAIKEPEIKPPRPS